MNVKKIIPILLFIPLLVLFIFPLGLFADSDENGVEPCNCTGGISISTGCYDADNNGEQTTINAWAYDCCDCEYEFYVMDSNGTVMGTKQSGTLSGPGCCDEWYDSIVFDSRELSPGVYTVIFWVACPGDFNNTEFVITDTVEVSLPLSQICVDVDDIFTIEECTEAGTIAVYKYSGDQPLAGAVFDVVDGEGFAAKVTSGADGFASLSGVAPGIYYVREVIAPEGYDIDPNQYTLTVESGGSARVDIENDPIEEPPPPEESTPPEEVEVAGVTEELPYTGYNWIYYIIGLGLVGLAGISYGFLRLVKSKK